MPDEKKRYSELEQLDLEKLSLLLRSFQLPKGLKVSVMSTPVTSSSEYEVPKFEWWRRRLSR